MSTFTNAPYSYIPGSDRLLGPVNKASSTAYVFNAANSLSQEATEASTSTSFYQLAGSAIPPTNPPSIPARASAPLSTSITVVFNSTEVTGSPDLAYSVLWGTSTAPTNAAPAVRVSPVLALYTATITGLTPSTIYYFKSVVTNPFGAKISPVSAPIITSGGGGTAPSGPPTVPVVQGSPTSTSITMTFSVAGITGTPTPTYSGLIGTTTTPTGPVTATLVSGTTYQIVASGLTPNVTYYFKSVASNGVSPNATSAVSAGILTPAGPPPPPPPPTPIPPQPQANLKTNLVTPFLIQGPRFGATPGAWTAIDYYINVDAVGATYDISGTTAVGQQVFASMYAGTIGDPGNATGSSPPCQYAGACIADQPFAALGGTGATNYSDAYLKNAQTLMGSRGRVLTSWGGFYADILGLFGPYQPAGFPGTNPTSAQVVQSFLYNYCGITGANTNPLNWVRTNASGNSAYTFYYQGMVLDFENVGNGNPLNSYPAAPANVQFPASATDPKYSPYIAAIGSIPATYYGIAPTLFLGNAPVSLSIVADKGTTNICAANTALNTWYPFATATLPPGSAGNPYIGGSSLALNHPTQLSYMDDIFVQFYNEAQPYYPGGEYFANLLACWGYVALEAQKLGRKKTTINLGLAKGKIIPGGGPPYVAAAQGPTPPLEGQSGPPYTYWYPQYCSPSPPNNTTNNGLLSWPNTGPSVDAKNVSDAIAEANAILVTATGNAALQPKDWLSGMGFWAGPEARGAAQGVYSGVPLPPNQPSNFRVGNNLPGIETYCWSDAYYPAPDPNWAGSLIPITPGAVE